MLQFTKAGQFLNEIIAWKRLLDFFTDENIFLKIRLSQVLDAETDSLFLKNAEYFNNQFIITDEYLQELRKAINEQEPYLRNTLLQSKLPSLSIINQQQKLRHQMDSLEFDFPFLKYQFNKYLSLVF